MSLPPLTGQYWFNELILNILFCCYTEAVVVKSGLSGLRILKTTQSAFVDFVQDEYTTLADAAERIFR